VASIIKLEENDAKPLKLGEKASILFSIKNKFAYFEVNDRAVFTEGDIKMTGVITNVQCENK
jgi:GTPase